MYHLTPEGPRNCRATVRNCPYSDGVHLETLEEAEAEFAKQFEAPTLNKKFAPAKSGIILPTQDEVQEILDDFRAQYPNHHVLKGELIGYSHFGSIVYNLDHPESDNDLYFLVDRKAKHDFQNIDAQNRDIRISSIYTFAKEYLAGTHFNIDLMNSGKFQLLDEDPWIPFIQDLRFNHYEYQQKLEHLVKTFSENAERRGDDSRRALKFLKTALRNQILANRFQREGEVRPVFTDEEREDFYRTLKALNRDYANVDDVYGHVLKEAQGVS